MPTKFSAKPKSSLTWIPATAADRTQVRAELEKLIANDLFRRSTRYSALLSYIVERTLEGFAPELKERTIGIDVFRRQADYDTSADPVVRYCAAEVRKRLAQYYRTPRESALEIALPVGSYVPTFLMHPSPEEKLPLPEETEPVAAAPLALPTPHQPGFARWHFWAGIPILLLGIVAIFVWHGSSRPSAVESFWSVFLNKTEPVQICTGTPPPDGSALPQISNLTIKENFLQSGHNVSFATASTIATLSGFLQARGQPFNLIEAETTTIDNLRGHPVILVNANNNRWTLHTLKEQRFHFESEGDTGYIVDTEHPEQKGWQVDFAKPFMQQTEDYAIVARLFNPTTRSNVLVVAGIGSNGTQAAGDFVVSQAFLGEWTRSAPVGWQKESFEIVLKVEVVQGHLGATHIVASHVW